MATSIVCFMLDHANAREGSSCSISGLGGQVHGHTSHASAAMVSLD